jgi:hypothetical protein
MPAQTGAMPRGETIDVLMKDQGVDFSTLATGNYTKTYIYSHGIEEKSDPVDDPLLGLARTNDRDATDPADGLPMLSGPIVAPGDFNHIGLHLKGMFGAAVVTGAVDPFTHTWQSGGENLPYRSLEVAVKNVDGATKFMQYAGVMHNKMDWEWSRGPGYQRATFGVTGRSEGTAGATGGGAPTAAWARDPILATLGVFKIGGTIVADILKCSLSYDNKATPQQHLTGSPYIAGYDLAENSQCGGSLDLRFRSSALYDFAVAKSFLVTEILMSKSGNRSLSFQMPRTLLFRTGVPISGPGPINQTFNFRAQQSGSAAALTTVLKSLVSAY